MALATTIAPAKSPAESPYKLEPSQVLKASNALLKHICSEKKKRREAESSKKNLLTAGHDDDSDDAEARDLDSVQAEPIWLILTTKKHITHQKSLKPTKIPLPHTLNDPTAISSICLITPDPQRAFKNVLASPAFPKELASKIRVLGISKVKAHYKSFEQRRQLVAEHDVFLADERVVTMLPKLMGKIMYESSTKRPLPVRVAGHKPKDENGRTVKAQKKLNSNKRIKGEDEKQVSVLKPEPFAREIEKALGSAQIHLSPSVTTAVRLGFSSFSPEHVAENVEAVVNGMVEKIIPKGWRNIRAVHIKGPNTAAMPIWLASELWENEEDVLEDEDAQKAKALETQKNRKRKGRDNDARDSELEKDKKQKRLAGGISAGKDIGFSKEMAERREKLREQKRAAKKTINVGA